MLELASGEEVVDAFGRKELGEGGMLSGGRGETPIHVNTGEWAAQLYIDCFHLLNMNSWERPVQPNAALHVETRATRNNQKHVVVGGSHTDFEARASTAFYKHSWHTHTRRLARRQTQGQVGWSDAV